jgi:hypothetical protein
MPVLLAEAEFNLRARFGGPQFGGQALEAGALGGQPLEFEVPAGSSRFSRRPPCPGIPRGE